MSEYTVERIDPGFTDAAFNVSRPARDGEEGPQTYTVSRSGSLWQCECKGFLHWHPKRGTLCRHIKLCIEAESLVSQ